MSALAQCDAFAFIYDQAGDPAPDVLVVLKRVLDASGNPILLGPKTTLTDSAGSFHFTLPEFATAFISARASALWNCPDGRAFTVPPGPSGELVPDFSLPPSTLVEPPLVYVGDVLSIPEASETQDGYLSAADFVRFEAEASKMVVTEIEIGTGLTGGPTADDPSVVAVALKTIPGVAGTWPNPTSIIVNAQGQIIAITAGAPDTTAPLITLVVATPAATSVTITWHTNEPADSQVDYSTDTSYGTSTPVTDTTSPVLDHSVTISTLAASMSYHYRVKSRDTASPPNAAIPVTGTFTTTAVLDTTPPVIALASTPVTVITDTSVTINWTTNENADSEVRYSTDTSYGTPTVPPITNGFPPGPGVTTHAVSLTGLTASQLYHYQVKSKDAAGNPATPVTGTFTTTAAPADLLTGLVSIWKMDESGATSARADSNGTNNLSVDSITTPGSGSVPAVTGKIGSAVHITGQNYLHHASNASLQSGDIDFVFTCWVKLDSKAADALIVGKSGGSSSADEYMIGYGPSADQFNFTVCGGPTPTYTTVFAADIGPVSIGAWYFVISWHDMSDGTVNIQVGTDTTFGSVNTAPRLQPLNAGDIASFKVGVYGIDYGPPVQFLEGIVDQVAFWKGRILDSDERLALWNGGAGLPFSSWT